VSVADPITHNVYPVEPLEWSDEPGALALKAKIEDYWRERGHTIECQLIPRAFTPEMRMARVDVRSNLLNGLPRPALRVVPSPEQAND
jgi:hypothetical protein